MQSRDTENRFFIVGLGTLLVLIGLVLPPLYAQDYPPDRTRGKAIMTITVRTAMAQLVEAMALPPRP